MSLVRTVGGAVLPVGSARRAKVLLGLRALGWTPPADDYQRWTRTVEPWLFRTEQASADAPTPVRFAITIEVDDTVSPADVDRTVLALQAQWVNAWKAVLQVGSGIGERVRACADRLAASEERLAVARFVDPEPDITHVHIALRAGDVLAPAALNEVLLAMRELDDPLAIIADADHLGVGGDRRAGLLQVHSIAPDSAAQFDVLGAFVACVGNSTEAAVRSALLRHESRGVVRLGLVLLHRGPGGARTLTLPPADADSVQESLASDGLDVSVGSGGPWFGTRVRYSTASRVCVVITNPLRGAFGECQRADLAAMARAGGGDVVVTDTAIGTSARDLASCGELHGAEVVIVVDGSLRVAETSFALDLAGSVLREGVAAVAPLVRAPSGMVVDAGLLRTDDGATLRARCGRIERPPHDLSWCCDVDALSGRMLAARTTDLAQLGDVALDPTSTRELARATGGRLTICAHQHAFVAFGLENLGGIAPGLAAWQQGRLANWFGEGITGYRPRTPNEEESVW